MFTSNAPMGALTGVFIAVAAYVLFSWAMSNGLIPVPSRRVQRWGALTILVVAGLLFLAELVLVIWAQLAR
ncbi:MAG: hypothetical protein U0610_05985 [bacterium]